VLTISGDVAGSVEAWEALAERVDAPPFLRPGWFMPWWTAFAPGGAAVACLYDRGELEAVLPLVRRRSRLSAAANYHTPWFAPLASRPDAATELLAGVLGRASVAELTMLDPPTRDAVHSAAGAARRALIERPLTRSPYVLLDGDWEGYRRSLKKGHRKEVGRLERRLAESGSVTFEVHRGGDELDERLEEVFAIEGTGWKASAGSAMASNAATRDFYTAVARWAADMGWLRLAFLRLDGRPIAVDYALAHAGVWHALKGGFDPGFARFGPGMLLVGRTLEDASAQGIRRFELNGDDDSYKLKWTDQVSPRVWVGAYDKSPQARLHHAGAVARQRAGPVVREARSRAGGAYRRVSESLRRRSRASL
jgi:CelD/BcsL family acetyltransferase involved in cellulose biosynthesis